MSNAVIQRLMWREYRTQRAFGIALLAMVVVLQLLYLFVSDAEPSERVFTVFTLALGFFFGRFFVRKRGIAYIIFVFDEPNLFGFKALRF